MSNTTRFRWAFAACMILMVIESVVLVINVWVTFDKSFFLGTRDSVQEQSPSVIALIMENKKLAKRLKDIAQSGINKGDGLQNANTNCIPPVNALNVTVDAINPFYRLEKEQFNFCIDNCNLMGIGSNLVRKDEFVDFVRDKIKGDFLRPVLPGANYYPPKCDFLWAGRDSYKLTCLKERLIFQNSFDLYHVQIHSLLSETYSLRLRQLAGEAFMKLTQKFKQFSQVEFVGVHVRHEFQYKGMKSDQRQTRNITIENYYEITRDLEANHKPKDAQAVYLAIGDSALSEFRPENYIYVEAWLEKEYPNLSRLQVMMVAIDILSRCRFRLVSKYGNNFFIHLAFHRLNNNIYNVVVWDVFVMRKYDYFGKELGVIGEGFDIKGYFKKNTYNPYMMKLDYWSHNYAVDCFRENLFSGNKLPPKYGIFKTCLRRFNETEVGRPAKDIPKTYPTKDLTNQTDFF